MAYIRFKIGECICPDCIGSGKKQELFTNNIEIRLLENPPINVFRLDCCMLCEGVGIVSIFNY